MQPGRKSKSAPATTPKGARKLRSKPDRKAFVFKLFISGSSSKSHQAIESIKQICEENFGSEYELEVIDVYQQPEIASSEHIVAVPALVQKSPGPEKKIFGDLSKKKSIARRINRG